MSQPYKIKGWQINVLRVLYNTHEYHYRSFCRCCSVLFLYFI